MVPYAHMHTVNASLNCISPPKCASTNPEGRDTDRDEDQRVSVAVRLISEIRWRPFREMRTESERWRKGEGESQPEVTGQMLKERQTSRQRQKQGQKIRGRDSFRSLAPSLFLYLVVINEQIRTVLHKCKSAGGEIKPFEMFLAFGPHTCFLKEQKLLQFSLGKPRENKKWSSPEPRISQGICITFSLSSTAKP